MSTAPKMRPATAAGKRKISAPAASAVSDSAPKGQSTFEDAMYSIQEKLAIKLEKHARDCEISTHEAILAVQPTEKLSAFNSGLAEWRDGLCASATEYYNNCFVIARKNRLQHEYLLSLAKVSSTDKLRSPAGFAKGLTEGGISTFLRITSMDREEPAHEIGSNGRVREFVRHVCDDFSDVYPFLRTEQNTVFRLPQWFDAKWNIKVSLAKLAWRPPGQALRTPAIDESSTLSIDETEDFILGMEELLVRRLRVAIADAHREALIVLGKVGIATEVLSKTGSENRAAAAPHVADPRPRHQDMSFSEDERTIYCCGESLPATKQQVLFIKALHTAWKNGQPELTNIQLAKASGCSKTRVTDTFRGPGEKLWDRFVETVSKGRYRLKLPLSPE